MAKFNIKNYPILDRFKGRNFNQESPNLNNEYQRILDRDEKWQYVRLLLGKLKNIIFLEGNLHLYIDKILAEDDLTGDYTSYISNLDRRVPRNVAEIIQKLYENKLINLPEASKSWLNDDSLYTESTDSIAEKIKILSFITNPDFSDKYNTKLDINDFRYKDTKKLKNVKDMRDQIAEYSGEKISEMTGEEYLRRILPVYNIIEVREFIVKNTVINTSSRVIDEAIKNDISKGLYDDLIDRILGEKLKTTVGIDLGKKLLFNIANAIYKQLSGGK